MVLENKIFHQQNNPFHEYEQFVQSEQKVRFGGKQALFVVLSPTGDSPSGDWIGISYSMLISAIKAQLAERFISQPIDKWCLLLREFVLHLESLMSQPTVNQQTLDFVLQNLTTIRDIQQTKQQVINEYHHRLQAALQNKLGRDVSIRLNTWNGYPALRFALSSWAHSESDVVLFLSGKADSTTISVYVHLRNNIDEQKADAIVLQDLQAKSWVEGGGKIRGYSVDKPKMGDPEIIEFICNRLLALDKLEQCAH